MFIYSKFKFRGDDLKKKIKYLEKIIKNKTKIFLAVDWFPSGHPESTSDEDLKIFKNENICSYYFGEREEDSMIDFQNLTQRQYIKIPNCADKTFHYPTKKYDKYSYDIVFLGAKLPKKKKFFEEILIPLKKKYKVGIFGPYWTFSDNVKRVCAKLARKYRFDKLNKVINDSRITIPYEDENKLYSSAKICLNYHEKENKVDHYHKILNQRAFKIPACGGFQLIDNLDYLDRYYSEDEIIKCGDKEEWFEKIDYFIKNESARNDFKNRAYIKTYKQHLYENRINQILSLANKI